MKSQTQYYNLIRLEILVLRIVQNDPYIRKQYKNKLGQQFFFKQGQQI